jgi:hypothetical protein
MKSSHFLLRLTWYLGLLTTLSGCESIPSAYGLPVPDLGNLTAEQKKSLQENYYLVPKGHYPLTSGSSYSLPSYRYDNTYQNTLWQMELTRQQAEHSAWMANQRVIEAEHRAWEARQRMEQPQEYTPATPPSSSFECSATSPCKQFKDR